MSLVAVYAAQEFLEGLLVFGHPAGVIGIFGFGGWWAIPSALAVGLILAAVLHGARAPALVMVGVWGLTFRVAPPSGSPVSVLILDQADG